MNKINIELQLEPAEWDVLYERTRRAYPDIKKEMDELGEPFSFEDAVRVEIRYIISKDIELFDVFDSVRDDPDVIRAVNNVMLRRNNERMDDLNYGEQ